MLYLSGDIKIMVLETANFDELKKGRPAKSPDNSVLVAWCPDIEWLTAEIEKCDGDGTRIGKLIDEASKRPEKPLRPYHEMVKKEFPDPLAAFDKILIAMVGLPRSGKSTWAKKQGHPIVCLDQIRYGLHGQRFVGLAEPFVWAIAKVMVRALFLAGHRHVILDATNMTKKRRDEWLSKDWGLFFKHIPTDPITCTLRAANEGDKEILPVIERMAGEFEPLTADDLLWNS